MWNVLPVSTKINLLKRLNFFFEIRFWEIERTREMNDQEDKNHLGKNEFDDNDQERRSWDCLGQTCSWPLLVFLWFCSLSLVAFEEFIFRKLVTNQLFGWKFCAGQQDTFYPHQNYEQVSLYKKSRLFIIGRCIRDGKATTCLQVTLKWNFLTKTWQKLLFLSTLSDTLWCYAKRNWKSRVCSRCKFWVYRFVKKQRYKLFVNLWRFMWRDLQFKSICWYCYCWQTSWIEYFLH